MTDRGTMLVLSWLGIILAVVASTLSVVNIVGGERTGANVALIACGAMALAANIARITQYTGKR